MNRHDLVYVRPEAWRTLMSARVELARDPIVANWVDRGWPLVGRRANAGEEHGLPLGLPLPPRLGKRRLGFLMLAADVVSVTPSPSMGSAIRSAPLSWRATLMRVDRLASHRGAEARVFGSLAWQLITGLDYLTDSSDLDFALHIHHGMQLRSFAEELSLIEADAPMRLDGELIRSDGAAVNWRELHAGAPEILVKTAAGIILLNTGHFLSGRMPL